MMIKVSIILPIYNVEKYLKRCMDSLLGQTLKDIEIVMVDDESPDHCPQLCEEYKAKYPNVKVVHKKNGGLGFARNSGLEVCEGEYVAFIDSDDFVDVHMFETFIGMPTRISWTLVSVDIMSIRTSSICVRGKKRRIMRFVTDAKQ